MKSLVAVFITSMIVISFLLAGITPFSLAQDSTSFKISGYILDSDGHGIAGAMIIFNVPQIVPAVLSDSSGYYVIYAPVGTYHVNVWPPFDSNYISYDEPALAVRSDITKNITLTSGYKVSGYITDSSGAPIVKAVVSMDNFFCGWYSKYSGRYFVTAPAGTYTLRARPANGPQDVSDFLTYSESNVVVNGDLAKNITVETPPPTKISGYILDAEGNGLAGAEIIFGVPDIVPSVFTNNSGYYTIYAPAGTYHVNVWPPFDSNYLYFDQPAFTVGTSDISKNITLSSGYKLSGYLTDSSGAPIRGALASLNQFHCGWYSNNTGYYFVTAPAGTYNLTIQPKTGPTFSTYHENNFALTGDTVKNFTLPTPSPEPTPNQSLPSYSDDFSSDSGFWQYLGTAYRDQTNERLVLTATEGHRGGVARFNSPIQGSFRADFRYKSSGGDGFTIFFYKQNYSSVGEGASLGFTTYDNEIVPGYGIEFDGWRNILYDFQLFDGGEINPPDADPSSSHIALIEGYVGNHLTYVNDNRVEDNEWHQVTVEVQESSVKVFVDQGLVLQWNGTLDRTYGGFGFSGGNGCDVGWHIIDDFSIYADEVQKPSLTLSCKGSASYSGFNTQIDGYLTIDGDGVADAPIFLSYSVNGGKSWEDLTLVDTDSDGYYSTTWLPSVTGNYRVKATYEGDIDKLGASSETVNFAVTNITEKNTIFSVSSNSTVTSLEFNSTTSALSFTVTGPSGTKGYVKCTIAKSLVSNAENIKLLLDGNQLSYDLTSNADSWLLYFTYTHSSHHISINLPTNAEVALLPSKEHWISIGVAIAIITVLIGISLLVYFRKRKH